jgi:hypothetical protein
MRNAQIIRLHSDKDPTRLITALEKSAICHFNNPEMTLFLVLKKPQLLRTCKK